MWGGWDGSLVKGVYYQAKWPEFKTKKAHERRDL